jgi:3-hydroxyisobutyrate dehydrogenase-like beta-hydroxyacid dehydrogenase
MPDYKIANVAVIGLGKMGLPMVQHLLAKGFKVAGFDVDKAKVAAAQKAGARAASSPGNAARDADLTFIAVGFDSEAEKTILGDDGVAKSAKNGAIVAIASTVAPSTAKKIAKRANRSDLVFLDTPMCRGEQAALDGKLLLMGGGDKAAFDACRPAFAAFASDVFHLGPLGAGSVGKMINNQILWACISANHEGLKLGTALGVERETLRTALCASSAQNWALETQIQRHAMPWAEKDMMLVLKEADAARLPLPLAGAVKEIIKGIKLELGHPTPTPVED